MSPVRRLFVTVLFAALAGTALGTAFAANDHRHDHGAPAGAPAADAASALSEGTVRKIDKAAGKITISHGPLANIGMPPMTMTFSAAQPAALDQVKAGDRIRFVAERIEGVFTVTTLELAK